MAWARRRLPPKRGGRLLLVHVLLDAAKEREKLTSHGEVESQLDLRALHAVDDHGVDQIIHVAWKISGGFFICVLMP